MNEVLPVISFIQQAFFKNPLNLFVYSTYFFFFLFFYQIDAIMNHIANGKIFVGVKKLLGLLDSMRVMKGVDSRKRVAAFVNLLEDEGIFTPEL